MASKQYIHGFNAATGTALAEKIQAAAGTAHLRIVSVAYALAPESEDNNEWHHALVVFEDDPPVAEARQRHCAGCPHPMQCSLGTKICPFGFSPQP